MMHQDREKSLKNKLVQEGFSDIFIQTDSPYTFYSNHTHEEETAHIIITGDMTLIVEGRAYILKRGDRFDVKKGTRHTARMGEHGCTYMIGRRG